MEFTGSPKKQLAASFNIFEDADAVNETQVSRNSSVYDERDPHRHLTQSLKRVSSAYPLPLTTSKLQNQLPPKLSPKVRETLYILTPLSSR